MFDPSFQTIWGGNLTAVFCDTGWEHPDTYKHVNDVCLQMGVRLITLKSKYDFVSLAVHKKRFPSTNARFCTSELKMKPMIDYVLSLKESCIIIQGIRAGESTARAAMEEECMYFKSYFQPNKKGRTENYRSKDVKEWCSQFDASVLRPIFKWSAQQVIDCILDAGQKPNPLYYRGFSRVGCFPCIMCRHKEIELIAKNNLEMKKIKDLTIKVTYRVGLSDVEVPDKVYDELAKAYDEGGYVPEGDDELENANEWLLDNIRQEDAMDWEFEIDDFQDE